MLPHRDVEIALTVALYTEWQAVLTHPEHLPAGATVDDVQGFLRYLASIAHLQDVHFLWRPFLRDPDDDMVLEAAANAGATHLVTFNLREFGDLPARFGIEACLPCELARRLRDGQE